MKELVNIFKSDQLILPIVTNDCSTNVINILERVFIDYIAKIREPKFDSFFELDERNKINKLCGVILSSIKEYLLGNPSEAVNVFEKAGKWSIEYLLKKEFQAATSFFRLREKEDNFTLSRKDLFHIPFQLRNKVNTQRFSISGFPCLYMGTSSYICWEELNRPKLDSLQISKIENIDSFSVYNLSFTQFKQVNPNLTKDEIKKLIFSYPIIAACSIKVDLNKRNDPFKEEYIFPHIIFQALFKKRDTNTRGIVYSTTKIYNAGSKNSGSFENIVLPTSRNVKETGYCEELTSLFRMSKVVAGWPIAFLSKFSSRKNGTYAIDKLELDGLTLNYKDTKFALLEDLLAAIPANPIKTDFKGE
jgi:hypothetical protein